MKNGETSSLESGVYSLPFATSLGAGQVASLGDVIFSFDEANDYIVIDGATYYDGDSLRTGGKIITVYNI